MSSTKTRKTQIRRDRRKAKQSGYVREGKRKASKVGHGTAGDLRLHLDTIPAGKAPKKKRPVSAADITEANGRPWKPPDTEPEK